MTVTIANRKFSFAIMQSRLWRLLGVVLPDFTAKSEAKSKVQRLKSLAQNLDLTDPIKIVDVGANPLGYDAPYQPLLDTGLCNVTGFEPQAHALDELNEKKTKAETYFNAAVGDGNTHDFYDYQEGGLSSLFDIDPRSVAIFPLFRKASELKSKTSVSTVRLDDFDGINQIDFFKIDIQGGELMVLENARKKLSKALAVQIELRFLPFYKDEPRMGEVDLELARHGFEIHTALPFVPLKMENSQHGNMSKSCNKQILDGDFMYVRDLRELEKYSDIELKKIAVLADGVFDSCQLAVRCIDILVERGAASPFLIKTYRKQLPARYRR